MKIITLFSVLALSLFSINAATAQAVFSGDGIYAEGSNNSYRTLKFEPVYWINATNEFVVYIPYKRPIVVTLQD